MLYKSLPYCFLMMAIVTISCDTASTTENSIPEQSNSKAEKESLVKVNRYLVNSENKEISN